MTAVTVLRMIGMVQSNFVWKSRTVVVERCKIAEMGPHRIVKEPNMIAEMELHKIAMVRSRTAAQEQNKIELMNLFLCILLAGRHHAHYLH